MPLSKTYLDLRRWNPTNWITAHRIQLTYSDAKNLETGQKITNVVIIRGSENQDEGNFMKSIGLIGLSNASRPFGQRLLANGYNLKVYDLNPEAMDSLAELKATKVGSAQEAVTDVTITFLP